MSHIENTEGLPKVVIIGRPNVGKSSLFNRILKRRKAIIESVSGVTRDRLYAHVRLQGAEFILVDTGGIVSKPKEKMAALVYKQSREAIDEAEAVIFVCDLSAGIRYQDEHIASIIKKSKEKAFLVVNKVDGPQLKAEAYEFHKLGLGEPYKLSALHGTGLKELFNDISLYIKKLPPVKRPKGTDSEGTKIAVVGRPNVGKSSLINCILDKERLLVDDVPGTTRDAVDITIRRDKRLFTIVDTAGMRHKRKIKETVEIFSLARSKESIRHADVAMVMLDASVGLRKEDIAVIDYVIKEGKACILLVNKWDLIEDTSVDYYRQALLRRFKPLEWVPIIFTSCKDKKNIIKALDLACEAKTRSSTAISTSKLNKLLKNMQRTNPHPADKRRRPKIFYATQTAVSPPEFILFCNNPKLIRKEYLRFVERGIRRQFGLKGVPLSFELKGKR